MTSRFWGASSNGLWGRFQAGGAAPPPTSTALLVGGTFGTGTANRTQYMATSAAALTFAMNADVGAACLVRANAAQSQTKSHWEWKVNSMASATTGSVWFGITDAATASFTSFVASTALPGGSGGTPGFTIRMEQNNPTQIGKYVNGVALVYSNIGGTFEIGADYFIFENDATTSANVCKVYWYDNSAGALGNGGAAILTVTLSGSYLLTTPYAFGGGSRLLSAVADSATVNFGASSNVMTPTSGYSIYA